MPQATCDTFSGMDLDVVLSVLQVIAGLVIAGLGMVNDPRKTRVRKWSFVLCGLAVCGMTLWQATRAATLQRENQAAQDKARNEARNEAQAAALNYEVDMSFLKGQLAGISSLIKKPPPNTDSKQLVSIIERLSVPVAPPPKHYVVENNEVVKTSDSATPQTK
jgi:hypothetical protein